MAEQALMESDQIAQFMERYDLDSPRSFIDQWGVDDLVCYDAAVVQSLALSEASKSFLIEIGLPRTPSPKSYPVVYRPFPTLPEFEKAFGTNYSVPSDCSYLRVVGIHINEARLPSEAVYAFVCLDEHRDGRVMEIYNKWGNGFEGEFLNSSIPQYAAFLLIARQYRLWGRARDREEEQKDRFLICEDLQMMENKVRQILRRIDSSALAEIEDPDGPLWERILAGIESDFACIQTS